ncbi:MAG: hypothetical protein IPM54_37505 [Polyangiaceae bacterium]|nr:hypothetical protein [Polyangiaceae bacterium]
MARDLSIYSSALEGAPGAELESSDERLLAIIEHFEKRNFDKAANVAEELAEEGIFDIRPLSYLLFVSFLEGGIAALGSIFDVIVTTLEQNLQSIGPQKNREAFYAKRMAWLFTTMSDHIAYYRKEGGTAWKNMRVGVTSESISDILERARRVDAALAGGAWEKPAMALGSLVSALRDLAEELSAAEQTPGESTKPVSAQPDAETNDDAAVEEENEFEGDEVAQAPVVKSKTAGKRTMTLDISPQFAEFLAKLQAFEKLVKKGDLMKAAIVAEDVQNIIENFDPRIYFPALLSRFSELLSTHAETLGEHIDNRDSFAWKTSSQFYKVDLDKFVRG